MAIANQIYRGVGATGTGSSTQTFPANVIIQGNLTVVGTFTGTIAPANLPTALQNLNTLGIAGVGGLLVQTGANTYTVRGLAGTANQVTVTNADGTAGNPTLSTPATFVAPGSITATTSVTATTSLNGATAAVAGAVTAGTLSVTAGNVTPTEYKNYYANPSGRVRQDAGTAQNLTVSGPSSQVFGADMWSLTNITAATSAAFTFANTNAPSDTKGDTWCVVATVTTAKASLAAGDTVFMMHAIEGYDVGHLLYGTANAKTSTHQLRLKASISGNYTVGFSNGTAARFYGVLVPLVANVFTDVTIVLPGDTTGTWDTTTGSGLRCTIGLGAGSTFTTATLNAWTAGNFSAVTGQTNLVGTVSNFMVAKDLKGEDGSIATPYTAAPFAADLLRCQRYYEQSYDYGTVVTSGVDPGAVVAITVTGGTYSTIFFKAAKRVTPSIVLISPATGATGNWRDLASATDRAATTFGTVGRSSFNVASGGVSVSNIMQGHWYAQARI